MKKDNIKGITLISLIITIIILLILASVATYSGVNVIKQTYFTRFEAELKVMQTEVNDLYEKYNSEGSITVNGTTYKGNEIANIGKDINTVKKQAIQVFTNNASGITDMTGYRYFDEDTIKALKIDKVDGEFFVNVAKRSVISYDGMKYENKMYYTLDQTPNGLYNIEYENKNTAKPTFDINQEKIEDNKYKVTISNIKYDNGYVDKWQLKYKDDDSTINDFSTTEDTSFIVDKKGTYEIYLQNGEIKSDIKKIYVGLKVGDTVTYTPSGTYNWQAEYCSDREEIGKDDVLLDSSKDDFKLTTWKVLDIDKLTKKVMLVPISPTKGQVILEGFQGYNNCVYLLNEACSKLYGDSSKEIEARSINIEDIESRMTDEALKDAHTYTDNYQYIPYNTQMSNPSERSTKYPYIYAQEKLSVINGKKNEKGLGLSEQPNLIKRTGTTATGDKVYGGYATAEESLQPYNTNWEKYNDSMKTAFKDNEDYKVNYYDLLIPQKNETAYMIASRSIRIDSGYRILYCERFIMRGEVLSHEMHDTGGVSSLSEREMFPIVTLNADLIVSNGENYIVK